jgi:hypothetical protein
MNIIYPTWIEEEFKTINFGDNRLTKRFKYIVSEFMKKAQLNISSVFDSWSSIKGCYRFFDNGKVESENILSEHVNATISRINQDSGIVCVLHDTTYIDYKKRKKTKNLDLIGKVAKAEKGHRGLILHNSFAINEAGVPMGLVNQSFTERKDIKPGTKKRKNNLVHRQPVEEKESYRWIEAINNFKQLGCTNKKVVHITDREGDFYELYKACLELEEKFLIRASHNRTINKQKRREPPKHKLFDHFNSLIPEKKIIIDLQANNETKYREAELSIAFDKFTLPPPPDRTINKDGKGLYNIELWGVMIKEEHPPKDEEALQWLLITNIPIATVPEAIEKMNWYILRWKIELFHKILKSGCSIEAAQLRTREKLIKYVTIKSIIAWRIFWLSISFKISKSSDCSTILTATEQEILFKRFNQGKKYYKPLSVEQAYIWIAKLGGYIGRNTDPPPGMISIWRGWTRLMNMVEDYQIICG